MPFWELPNLVVSNLVCKFYSEALLSALLHPFALFCVLSRSFADLRLCSFTLVCVFLHPTAFKKTAIGHFGSLKFSGFRSLKRVVRLTNLELPTVATQRRKKRTLPRPKENILLNFSGLKEELSRPVVDTKTQ